MSHSTPEMKICTKCNNEFPATLEYFPKRNNHLHSWCRACKLAYNNEWRHKNPEKDTAHKQKWNEKNPDKLEENRKRYYAENREWYLDYGKNYHQENKVKRTEQIMQWRKENPERYRAIWHRYMARKRNLPDTFTGQDWLDCLEYFNYTCAVCGSQLRDLFGNVEPHADHWIPLASELCTGTIPQNMVCLCNSCNTSKNAKLPQAWLEEKYDKRKAKEILNRVQAYFDSL